MATRAPGPLHRPAPDGSGSAVELRDATRQLYLDNLKVVLIAAIIAGHAVVGYSEFAAWSYADVREVTLSPVAETVLLVLVGPLAMVMIPLLFLAAGLLTPRSLERKGPGAYARDRLLRLGVPFAVFVLVLQPALLYALYHPLGEAPRSYWYEFLGSEKQLDTGPLWFVGVLLIFSLAYAGWVRMRRGHAVRPWRGAVGSRHLLGLAALVTIPTFLVRLVYPFASDSGFTDLNLWEWPSCVALFGLGIAASRQGWLSAVPDRLRRQSRAVTLATVGAFAVFLACMAALGVVEEDLYGGWHWQALTFVALESTLTVFGPVWLLGTAQRRLDRGLPWGAASSRYAYGAFILQGLVLIGLAVTLRPLPLPAELKALIVGAGGVAGSFALAGLLINRVPGMARIL